MLLLWLAPSPWMAFTGAALTGFGFSLVFPSIGVEAVKRVSEENRGTALGVYTAFADVSFFLTGPVAGSVIGALDLAARLYFVGAHDDDVHVLISHMLVLVVHKARWSVDDDVFIFQ